MPLQVEVYDSLTGDSILPVEAAVAGPTRRMTGSGEGEFTFKLADLYERLGDNGMSFEAAKTYMRDTLFKSRRRMIGVHDGGTVMPYAGFIMKRASINDAAGTLTVSTSEFRIAAMWRMLTSVKDVQAGTLVATGKSAQGALRLILDRMVNQNPNPLFDFPLDLGALADGSGPYGIDAQWYDTFFIEDLLQQLEEKGLEIDFNPTRVASTGRLSIVPRIATTIQSTAITDLTTGSAKSAVLDLQVVEDSTVHLTGVLAGGTGSGSDTKFEWAGDPPGVDIPYSDVRRDFPDLKDATALQQAASAELDKYIDGVEQWSFAINLDDAGLGWEHVQIGRRVRLDVRNHWWIPDDQYVKRIIAARLSTIGSSTVTVEVQ